jgi:DHA2 family multidrug resistance protein
MAIAMFASIRGTDLQMSLFAATILRIYQCIPLAALFVPITLAAYVGLPAEKSNAAAGLVNFMRNIGGSVGTSIVATMVARRSQFHQSILAQHTRSWRFRVPAEGLARQFNHAGLGYHDAHNAAVAGLARMIQAQAALLSYIDLYWLFCVAAVVMFFLSFLLRKNTPGEGGEVAMH